MTGARCTGGGTADGGEGSRSEESSAAGKLGFT